MVQEDKENEEKEDWGDGSGLRAQVAFSKRSRFNSYLPHADSQLPVIPAAMYLLATMGTRHLCGTYILIEENYP